MPAAEKTSRVLSFVIDGAWMAGVKLRPSISRPEDPALGGVRDAP